MVQVPWADNNLLRSTARSQVQSLSLRRCCESSRVSKQLPALRWLYSKRSLVAKFQSGQNPPPSPPPAFQRLSLHIERQSLWASSSHVQFPIADFRFDFCS